MSNLEALDDIRSGICQRDSRQAGNQRRRTRSHTMGAGSPSGLRNSGGAPTDHVDAGIAPADLHAAQTALAHASRIAILAEMSATVAHEVNQPLAAIVMGAEAGLRWLSREDLAEIIAQQQRIPLKQLHRGIVLVRQGHAFTIPVLPRRMQQMLCEPMRV